MEVELNEQIKNWNSFKLQNGTRQWRRRRRWTSFLHLQICISARFHFIDANKLHFTSYDQEVLLTFHRLWLWVVEVFSISWINKFQSHNFIAHTKNKLYILWCFGLMKKFNLSENWTFNYSQFTFHLSWSRKYEMEKDEKFAQFTRKINMKTLNFPLCNLVWCFEFSELPTLTSNKIISIR